MPNTDPFEAAAARAVTSLGAALDDMWNSIDADLPGLVANEDDAERLVKAGDEQDV